MFLATNDHFNSKKILILKCSVRTSASLVHSEKKYCHSLNITSKLSIIKVENSFDIEIAFQHMIKEETPNPIDWWPGTYRVTNRDHINR